MTNLVKRIDMALHIQELCAEHKITVKYQEHGLLCFGIARNRTFGGRKPITG